MAVYTQIDNPELYFQCKTYGFTTGAQSITFDNTDTSMQPDMVWIKSRSNAGYNHVLNDSTRGVTKFLRPNLTSIEATITDALTSFDSNGFTLGADGTNGEHNDHNQSQNYIAWCWKESADAGFDIVTYTGDGSNRTISHSLNSPPKFYMIKDRGHTHNWRGFHASLGADKNISWEINAGEQTGSNYWQDTAPTSSVFSLGNQNETNQSSHTFVNYLWSEKQGFSKVGKFIGSGNVDGTFVPLTFRPSWVMIKRSNASVNWYIFDNKRDPFNVMSKELNSNNNEAEATELGSNPIDFLSNGFKLRVADSFINGTGDPYIFMAFAEAPLVNSNGVPGNAR